MTLKADPSSVIGVNSMARSFLSSKQLFNDRSSSKFDIFEKRGPLKARAKMSQTFISSSLPLPNPIAHDRSKEFHWKFNRPVAAKMIQLQNPLLRFLKTTKGNFSGEDFLINPTVPFLDDSDSLAQIMPYCGYKRNVSPVCSMKELQLRNKIV